MDADLRKAAEVARALVTEAAAVVAGMQDGVEARDKGGGDGLVTDADLAAERVILAGLRAAFPADAVLAEETRPDATAAARRVWCVDPLDGTREYARGLPEYACMVGLLVDGEPVAGAVALPAGGGVLWGGGGRAFDGDAPVELGPAPPLAEATMIHSRSHKSKALADVIARLAPKETKSAGSAGYKVAQIMRGTAHLYIHVKGGTKWWDSVAPAAVLRAAGGTVGNARGEPLAYDTPPEHPDGLLFAAPGLEAELRARL